MEEDHCNQFLHWVDRALLLVDMRYVSANVSRKTLAVAQIAHCGNLPRIKKFKIMVTTPTSSLNVLSD